MKNKLELRFPQLALLQKISFWIWVASLAVFSGNSVYQNLLEKPWQNNYSQSTLFVSVIIGFFAFCLNSILGITMRLKKEGHFKYGFISYLLSILWVILFVGGMMIWSPGVKNVSSNTLAGPMSTLSAIIASPSPSPTPKPIPVDPYLITKL